MKLLKNNTTINKFKNLIDLGKYSGEDYIFFQITGIFFITEHNLTLDEPLILISKIEYNYSNRDKIPLSIKNVKIEKIFTTDVNLCGMPINKMIDILKQFKFEKDQDILPILNISMMSDIKKIKIDKYIL